MFQQMGGIGLSYTVVFAIWSVVMLATIPTIFAMLKSPNAPVAARPQVTDT
ncbi:MAG: hypothetical protein AB1597_04820 [Chloroflexota bacterium]